MYTATEFRFGDLVVPFPAQSTVVPPSFAGVKPHVKLKKVELKHCYVCGKWLPLDSFCRDDDRWDSLRNKCMECSNGCCRDYNRRRSDCLKSK